MLLLVVSLSVHTLMLIWNLLFQQILPCVILPCDTVQNLQLIYTNRFKKRCNSFYLFFSLFIIHLNFDRYGFQTMTKLFIYENLTLWHCQYLGYPLFCNQLISLWPNIINKLSVLCVIIICNNFGHFDLGERKKTHLECYKVRCSTDRRRSPLLNTVLRFLDPH